MGPDDALLGQRKGRYCSEGSVPALLSAKIKFVAEGLKSIRRQATVTSTGSINVVSSASAFELLTRFAPNFGG